MTSSFAFFLLRCLPRGLGGGLVCWLSLSGSVAWAQSSTGTLRGVVFGLKNNKPLSGIKVAIPAARRMVTTDIDGAFQLDLPGGRRYTLKIFLPYGGAVLTRPIPVVEDEVTEALLTLRRQGKKPIVDVEALRFRRKRTKTKVKRRGPVSRVEGLILHAQKNTPIADASVFVRGFSDEVKSNAQGKFVLMLPIGKHDITILHPKFLTASRKDVEVRKDETVKLKVSLIPASLQLKTFTVSAPRITGNTVELMRQRKESGSVTEVLGAEAISKSGDSNAAGALKRVSGVTLVGGKYVYVRGLGERYSSSLLNNALLPSPEPERRVVPLNLFPAGILEKIVIEKTYLPYLPGEFAGGMIQLYTRAFPKKFRASISLSSSIRLGTTFLDGLRSDAGPIDFLGVDGGFRALPPLVLDASKKSKLTEGDAFSSSGFSLKELETFGEAMPNTWRISRAMTPPNLGVSFTIGDSYKLGGGRYGFFLYGTYNNSWFNRPSEIVAVGAGAGGVLVERYRYQSDQLANTIRLGGLFVLGADFTKNHKLRLTTFLNRTTLSENLQFQGYQSDAATDIRVTRLRWIEQTLLTQQIRGIHKLDLLEGFKMEWRYTYSLASRDEPDRRTTRYDREGEDLWLMAVNSPNGNQRVFSYLFDNNHDIGLDFTLNFKQWGNYKAKVRAGVMLLFRDRNVDTRRFKFDAKSTKFRGDEFTSLPPEQLFVPAYIDPQGYVFVENTRGTDNYKAQGQIAAGYAMTDLPLGAGFRLVGGVRFEYWRQLVITVKPFDPNNEVIPKELTTFSVLPGVGLAWSFRKDMLFRTAFARTVNRPDFRERSPAAFDDVDGGRLTRGNEDLQPADITHADLRWEWYLGRGESISLAVFYKYFERPIETVLLVSTEQTVTYANANAAHNFGVELDFRKNFGFIHKVIRDVYIAGNATFVWSNIDLGEATGSATSLNRALQGQSPYIFNVRLGYDNAEIGTQVAVLYNVFGPRISEVGTNGVPDTYEQPFHQLDIVWRQKIWRGFNLSFKASNLIDLPNVFLTRGQVTRSFRRGRSFSVSLGYTWK